MRTILHSDLNNFYASVECMTHPELQDKYVAVVGDAEARHGIVLAKNQRAKACGIQTGMVIWQAKQLCPQLVAVPADFKRYLYMAEKVREIYRQYTDRVECFGIDECWLDVTDSARLFGSGAEIAERIREEVKRKTGLTVSVGVSFTKTFAKLGSDMRKPDAVTVIDRDNYRDVVWPLPAGELLYVGRATKRKLASINIRTIGDIARADVRVLEAKLGKWGDYLHCFANGRDRSAVSKWGESMPVKSVGNSMTNYRDLNSTEEVRVLLSPLVDSVAARCREMGGYKVTTVHVCARDSRLLWYGKQGKLPLPTLLSGEIFNFALQLFQQVYPWRCPVRGIGVAVSGFVDRAQEQLDLARDEAAYRKRDRLEETVQAIRAQYGNHAIRYATVLQDDVLRQADIREEHVIHPVGYLSS